MHPKAPRNQRGQALVFMVIAMIPALIMVALIVDGGNAWAQQRIAQNGTDSAADGGATVLGQRLAEASNPNPLHDSAYWDGNVRSAVMSNGSANGVTVLTGNSCDATSCAYYTDICGTLLRLDGTKATGPGDAAKVGGGTLPGGGGATPDCPSGTVGPVAGVYAIGTRTFGTFIASVVSTPTMTAGANATAVAGYLQGGLMLPIAFPLNVTYCDGSGNAAASSPSTPWPKYTLLTLPICKHAPGSVGWIHWPGTQNGTPGLITCIQHPCNPDITLPEWMDIAQPGGTDSGGVEDALNAHAAAGDIVLLPQFDGTCGTTPTDLSQADGVLPYGCPMASYNDMHGSAGSWYRIKQIAAFQIQHAYTNGNNKTECNNTPYAMPAPEDAKANDCLVGVFVDFITTGTVGVSNGQWGTSGTIGVQLIH
jgi:hypothetical protein